MCLIALPAWAVSETYGDNIFDQELNTTDDVEFNSVTGDGSGLTGVDADTASTADTVNSLARTDDTMMIGNDVSWQGVAISNCLDSGGNHMNYDASTNEWSCGTSSSSSSGPCFSVYLGSNQTSFPDATTEEIQFDTVEFDPNGLWNGTTYGIEPSAADDGFYSLQACVEYEGTQMQALALHQTGIVSDPTGTPGFIKATLSYSTVTSSNTGLCAVGIVNTTTGTTYGVTGYMDWNGSNVGAIAGIQADTFYSGCKITDN